MHHTPAPAFRRLAAPAAVAAATATGCVIVVWADPTTPGGLVPVCPTKALLGIDCPFCGGSRMLYALLHLDLPGALRYNAVGVAALALVLAAYLTWTWGRLRRLRTPGWYQHRWIPAVAVAVTLVWFVARNIPIAPFTSLRV